VREWRGGAIGLSSSREEMVCEGLRGMVGERGGKFARWSERMEWWIEAAGLQSLRRLCRRLNRIAGW